MTRRTWPLMLTCAAALTLFLSTTPARAATGCSPFGSTAFVNIDPGASATLKVSGGAIQLNGVNCGTATVTNTGKIVVSGAAGAETLTVDLRGGAFAPGPILEATGLPEIELEVDLGAGLDKLVVRGTSGADIYRVGTAGVNLNDDDDADVTGPAGGDLGTIGAEKWSVFGGAGADTISGQGAIAGVSAPVPSPFPLELQGGSEDDTLTGGSYDDTIAGGSGDNTLAGGAGEDAVDYSAYIPQPGTSSGVVVYLDLGLGDRWDGNDSLSEFERVFGSAYPDLLNGSSGDDGLRGNGGDDLLVGLAGRDGLNGGSGNDTVDYRPENAAVWVDLAGGFTTSALGRDQLSSVENAIGSAFADVILGTAGANMLAGVTGDDSLHGGSGDDFVLGEDGADEVAGDGGSDNLDAGFGDDSILAGPGNDEITGGLGNDSIDGAGGIDKVVYDGARSAVNVSLAGGTASGGFGSDTLSNVENLYGSTFSDTLTGSAFANDIDGSGGNDTLNGGPEPGPCTGVCVAPLSDMLDGGVGADTATYANRNVPLQITLDGVANDGAAGENDQLLDIENAKGGSVNDVIVGNVFANQLVGNRGSDQLDGQGGPDTLISSGDLQTPDSVTCGTAIDSAFADIADNLAADCENVTILP